MIEIFKFEIVSSIKSPLVWMSFFSVLLISLFAIDFIYEGSLGPIKENAPYVIAVSMSFFSSFLMVLSSFIMGMSVLKDYESGIHLLMYTNPIHKREYLLGRFMGSFCILLFISFALPIGVMLSEFLPWRDINNMLPFNLFAYIKPYVFIVIPTLFFCGVLFFFTAALSRKLVVVYTQGVVLLMLYLLSLVFSRGIDTQIFLSQILDPFNFQTVKVIIKDWTIYERNINELPYNTYILYNRIVWITAGIVFCVLGYRKFKMTAFIEEKSNIIGETDKTNNTKVRPKDIVKLRNGDFNNDNLKSMVLKFWVIACFQFKMILKEPLFITVLITAIVTVVINSINLDSGFGIDNLPMTYLVVEELNELTFVFFLMLLVFYSGEIIWKERDIRIDSITNTLPVSNAIYLSSKLLALILIYFVLMLVIIIAGLIFQTLNLYFIYDLKIYFISIVLQNLPFLIIYSVLSIFIHVLINNKHIAYVVFILFFIFQIAIDVFGYDHFLYVFASADLGAYTDLNDYGYTFIPFLWVTSYWLAFSSVLLFTVFVVLNKGESLSLLKRLKVVSANLTPNVKLGLCVSFFLFLSLGSFVFYNTNILNVFMFQSTENRLRAGYEKKFKSKLDVTQPTIVGVNLELDLYPHKRSYELNGIYELVNRSESFIDEIHVQAFPNHRIELCDVAFDRDFKLKETYKDYKLSTYSLSTPLDCNDTLIFSFKQTFSTKGFVDDDSNGLVFNGTFLRNDQFPTLGYNDNIELEDNSIRSKFDLIENESSKPINDLKALSISTLGDDADFIDFEIVIKTSSDQTAIAPGLLVDSLTDNDRSMFHYKAENPIVNFFPIVSASFERYSDHMVLNNIDTIELDVFYHSTHNYNIDKMMNGLKTSLKYCSTNFGRYSYGNVSILEIPRYNDFAQSFPSTIAFSESLGFVMNVSDTSDIDMPFFIAAHELAHQWWGLKLLVADVEGHDFLLESQLVKIE